MNETSPWQILGEKQVYDNNWIQVTEYDVLNPGGGKGIYGKVHFKNLAIGVIVLDEQENTYLVGQFRFPLNEYSWEIPEGGGAIDTDPLESAKRELLEETGLKAKEWRLILKMHLSNSVSDEYALIFLATGLEQFEPMPEETEQLVIKKLPFEEAWKMQQAGQITDSMSVAAIQQVKLMMAGLV
ncbi:NUDIX hydrolase [Terrimonas sp. NA20]|uniref:GDP-mannose pyrophosphatase n=1 Tax=Terrimonas ginsenosidimutans TaxID=2908004 RepID=A0ABS9KW86_9BACT|nr:NUDIX hydrolase [Terrimonas ginsenosidimutans]MCG2616627.1 NUDIX hydrolase [Terrimonas ginsenosidimutans]